MATIERGSYTPLYGRDSSQVAVDAFLLDTVPVTKAEYLAFVKDNPKWRKSNVKGLFADDNYLNAWQGDLQLNPNDKEDEPVTNVSWFAAKAYCKCQGKRLPTLDEWEYVAMADDNSPDARKKDSYNQYILSWYERPKDEHQQIGSTRKNYWGVYDMHGLVWEWTQDFNSVLISSESRNGGKNKNLFCSAAAVGATDLMNYAAFMRYAFRSSVKGNYTINNLGFRCAKDIEKKDSL
ncbi:formylglycine-generating enzyme family protein [Marixanthomonas spongiae]|uniref:Sulfatase-modifying factor enzyme-like domain-containing protein n=1 Tax=Marixanthomonas spongiae TaxID=2174845 RepID=A0A2U0I477_9FLAO|nr:formylglycine-generating enzyme family protein [Marixanthomonas spongiae]PVW15911.1 hypothetical protein DDV96_06000 [Marixanthomonas spongiae]